MAFEINRLHKLEDNLDSVAYEWCVESIRTHFDLGYEKDITEVLTEEQVIQIQEYQTSLRDSGWIEKVAYSALNGIIDQWYQEQPDDDVDNITPTDDSWLYPNND